MVSITFLKDHLKRGLRIRTPFYLYNDPMADGLGKLVIRSSTIKNVENPLPRRSDGFSLFPKPESSLPSRAVPCSPVSCHNASCLPPA